MADPEWQRSSTGVISDRVEMVRVGLEEADALAAAALRGVGYSPADAETIKGQLLTNALDGYLPAALSRIPALGRESRTHQARQPICTTYETEVSAQIDGGNNVGYVSVYHAMEVALEKARKNRFAFVGVSNCPFSGRSAYYVEQIARAGFFCISSVAGQPHVLPLGGTRKVFGTNPITFAFPNDPDPVIFDMSTSIMMWGDVMMRARLGETLPPGIGFDRHGHPSTDAAEVEEGGIVPFGGHKGYGLSFVVQAMGLLAGSYMPRGNTSDYGALFMVADPGLLVPPDDFKAHLAALIRTVKETPRQPGVDEILIPSERAFRERRRRRAEGFIEIDKALLVELKRLASLVQTA